MYPSAMTYIGFKIPHNILKRAYRKSMGKKTNPEKDNRLWKLADRWTAKMMAHEELNESDLPDEITMKELLKAIDDIHGREIASDVYEFAEIREKTEDSCAWILNDTRPGGFSVTNYYDWVTENVVAIKNNNSNSSNNNLNDKSKSRLDVPKETRHSENGSEDVSDEGEDEEEDEEEDYEDNEDNEDKDEEDEDEDEDEDDEHFGVVDVTNYIMNKEQGPTQVCFTVWSQSEEMKRKDRGNIFVSCPYAEMMAIIERNKDKVNKLLDKLGITESEYPRTLEIFTGVSA
jgi:hypothetical protein